MDLAGKIRTASAPSLLVQDRLLTEPVVLQLLVQSAVADQKTGLEH